MKKEPDMKGGEKYESSEMGEDNEKLKSNKQR